MSVTWHFTDQLKTVVSNPFFVMEKHKRAQKGHLWRRGKDLPDKWKLGRQEEEMITLHFSVIMFLPQMFADGHFETGLKGLLLWPCALGLEGLFPRTRTKGRRCAWGWHGNSSGAPPKAGRWDPGYLCSKSLSRSQSYSKISSEYFPVCIFVQIHVTKAVVVSCLTWTQESSYSLCSLVQKRSQFCHRLYLGREEGCSSYLSPFR